jgi:SNF2 family DNA or RNA helicase
MAKELIAIIEPHGEYALDWQEANTEEFKICHDLYKRYENDPYGALLFLGFQPAEVLLSPSLFFLKNVASEFVRALSKTPDLELLREKATAATDEESIKTLLESAPFMPGNEWITEDWVRSVWGKLNLAFAQEIGSYSGKVSEYFSSHNAGIHLAGRVYFHLVENKSDDSPFAFLATYSTHVSQDGKSKHVPLKHALTEFGKDGKKMLELLVTVHKAAEKSAFIADILESREIFYPLKLTASEAYTMLREIPLYEESGILCRIPDWWKNKSDSIKVSVKIGEKNLSRLNFDAVLNYNVELSLGGETLTLKELKRLLSESEGLALIKNRWVEIDHGKLKEILLAYERAQSLSNEGEMGLIDAMRLQLNAGKLFTVSSNTNEFEISNGTWLQTVLSNLIRPDSLPAITCGSSFNAELRAYQTIGLNWLGYMRSLGLGACLADDMGLGKTVQIIALLNHLRSSVGKALIVIPASLIGNWMNELKRFAPQLACLIVHPSEHNSPGVKDAGLLEANDVFITTYGLISKYEWLSDTQWDYLILDEAQTIKNPHTRQTKAVKRLKAKHRVAMTGTPIENRLSDLWSLFDFINPGLLGSAKEFTVFTKGLKDSPEGYARLKKVVSPFILRRLKTDGAIISDLPEKIEMKTYTTLSKKQAALYTGLVEDLRHTLEKTKEGIQRKGILLGALLKFKQICNHPDQYLGQKVYAEPESGKFARLREICETIGEKRERMLIFTQFKEITAPLADYLEGVFGHKGLVLHGEVAVKKRGEIVDAFQGHAYVPFIVLSIKAGGVGLNLTAANHVVHFDRWWNPAVENQATDRAFRIGQKRNVLVHKFITKGTIEEKIDLMIEDKIKLARDILPESQENWITEMSNEELLNLFTLSV